MPSMSGFGLMPAFLYLNLVVVELVVHPTLAVVLYAPGGRVVSMMSVPSCFSRITRAPFKSHRMVGVVGRTNEPLILSLSSPGAVKSFRTRTFTLVAKAPPLNVLLHGSHTSPNPSLSLSSCPGSGSFGQSSCASHVPSPSPSG